MGLAHHLMRARAGEEATRWARAASAAPRLGEPSALSEGVRELLGEAGGRLGPEDLAGTLAVVRALLDALEGDGPAPPSSTLPAESPLSPAARVYVRAIHADLYRSSLRLRRPKRRALADQLRADVLECERVSASERPPTHRAPTSTGLAR